LQKNDENSCSFSDSSVLIFALGGLYYEKNESNPERNDYRIGRKARAYLCTAEGERSLLDAFQRGKVEAQRLREISKADPQSLKCPLQSSTAKSDREQGVAMNGQQDVCALLRVCPYSHENLKKLFVEFSKATEEFIEAKLHAIFFKDYFIELEAKTIVAKVHIPIGTFLTTMVDII
jgi:hypothetical protein